MSGRASQNAVCWFDGTACWVSHTYLSPCKSSNEYGCRQKAQAHFQRWHQDGFSAGEAGGRRQHGLPSSTGCAEHGSQDQTPGTAVPEDDAGCKQAQLSGKSLLLSSTPTYGPASNRVLPGYGIIRFRSNAQSDLQQQVLGGW